MGAFVRQRGKLALVAVLFLALTGCKGLSGPADVTGSVAPPSQEAYRKLAETWGKRYQANPGDKSASLHYARALRGMDEKAQAASVLQQAAARNPDDPEILAAFGKLLVELGQFEQARAVLARAYTPDVPNARVMSAQAVIADQNGEHGRAQALYRSALKQDANDPVILTNLGLSLILSRQAKEAEAVLRRAIASPRADARMRETLALALLINGNQEEAVSVLGVDMPPSQARLKVADLQQSATGEGLMQFSRSLAKAESTASTSGKSTKPPLKPSNAEAAFKPPATPAQASIPDTGPLRLRSGLPDG